MPGVVMDETVDCNNPLLQFFYHVLGKAEDVAELYFKVRQVRGDIERVAEVTVDLTDCASGGHKLSLGRYSATFTPASASWEAGTHEIIWRYVATTGDPSKFWRQKFEVLNTTFAATGGGYVGYADTVDLVDTNQFSCYGIDQIHDAIAEASNWVQDLTGRFFDPRFLAVQYNATNAGALPFFDPIIGLNAVRFIGASVAETATTIDLASLRIYNRHLAGLVAPDDRDNPRIEFVTDFLPGRILSQGRFQLGRQNTYIEGMFGYREFNATPMGGFPRRLQRAVAILALRRLQDPFGEDPFVSQPGRIRTARTRDQQIGFAGAADGGVGPLTGDRVVDDILIAYMRPPYMGTPAQPAGRGSRVVTEAR